MVLASLWSQVLQVEQVGIHDEFLHLGGDSLLATRLIARVRDLLRVELSVLSLFDNAHTVADMAAAILSDPAARAKVERTAQLWVEVAELPESDVECALRSIAPRAGGAKRGQPLN
jgi:acyl carrier protein